MNRLRLLLAAALLLGGCAAHPTHDATRPCELLVSTADSAKVEAAWIRHGDRIAYSNHEWSDQHGVIGYSAEEDSAIWATRDCIHHAG